MKNELDSKLILRVFEKIKQNGKQQENTYVLGGLKAYTDFDGYTLFVEDALVNLSFGFHNQYHLNYEKESHLEQFISKLKEIEAKY